MQLAKPDPYAYAYARNTALSDRIRRALESVAELRQAVEKEQSALNELDTKRSGINSEQERVRQNLARVPASSDLHKRYLDMLRQQEDEIQALSKKITETRERMSAARARLSDEIKGIDL